MNTCFKKIVKEIYTLKIQIAISSAESPTVACQAPLWNSPSKNTEMGSHSLFQEIFPTQGSNPGLLPCRQILYHLSHLGSHFKNCKRNIHIENSKSQLVVLKAKYLIIFP